VLLGSQSSTPPDSKSQEVTPQLLLRPPLSEQKVAEGLQPKSQLWAALQVAIPLSGAGQGSQD
jgi:hypothetical protein